MKDAILIRAVQEAKDIKRFDIECPGFEYKCGQYVMIAFADKPDEKRAFSVVSKKGDIITLGIKRKGEFTSRLFEAKKGTRLLLFGPYGKFTLPKEPERIVFIAGGIGITPILSMASSADARNKTCNIFYCAKTKEEMAFYKEVKALERQHEKVNLRFTKQGDKRISCEDLKRIEGFKDCYFYICGPPPMIASLREQLEKSGVNPERIRSERF